MTQLEFSLNDQCQGVIYFFRKASQLVDPTTVSCTVVLLAHCILVHSLLHGSPAYTLHSGAALAATRVASDGLTKHSLSSLEDEPCLRATPRKGMGPLHGRNLDRVFYLNLCSMSAQLLA